MESKITIGFLRRPGRRNALDRAARAMTAIHTTRSNGHESIGESLQNQRVTARIVRKNDGTTRREYRIGGRVYHSLEALRDALGGRP
ncbi:hypothetical protein [Halosimplex carlsbadense]|uniref:hypothetical protein n=1 Tax=Halosimplex carlsbadense TaxID=171164 RepID=UPI0018722968|nr:hypothetical protein [Halosimplex carlsbadense]